MKVVPFLLFVLSVTLGPAHCATLEDPISALEPLLGTWEVEASWAGGNTLWSRAEYVAGANGRTVEGRVVVSDNGGEPYRRYFGVFLHDADRDQFVVHTFERDGSHHAQDFDFIEGALVMQWAEGEQVIRDRTLIIDDQTLSWTVGVKTADATEFTTVMDARWRKQSSETERSAMIKSIDTSLFDGTGPNVRSFTKEATIGARLESVYAAWTNGEAFRKAFDPTRPELAADIQLAIGGPYEWLWDGKMGSNGCQVLSYIPNRMVSFSWNAPPDQPLSRARHTWVVVEFEAAGEDATRVTLTHLGFGTEAHWNETFEYFSQAWPFVFEQMRKHLEG